MEKEFQWTDELVREMVKKFSPGFTIDPIVDASIKEFKQSHRLKKDWEIVSFKDKYKNVITTFSKDDLPYFLSTHIYSIHSVHRLSDGEVFSVGDRINVNTNYPDNPIIFNIASFTANGDYLIASPGTDKCFTHDPLFGYMPNQWVKAPETKKDWEIVSFMKDGKVITKDDKGLKYRNDTNSISDVDWLIKNFPIHSVRRLSDNTVWTVGDDSKEGVITHFEIIDDSMWVDTVRQDKYHNRNPFFSLSKASERKVLDCNQCGGEMVLIRGRYPKDDKRLVCPTCATERLEQINEMSSKHYGQTSTNSK